MSDKSPSVIIEGIIKLLKVNPNIPIPKLFGISQLEGPTQPAIFGNTLATRYVVGVLAAWTSESATYPLDMIKTRLQIQSEAATGMKRERLGMMAVLLKVIKKEGPLGPWAGIVAMLQRHAIYGGSRIVIYETLREIFKDENKRMGLLTTAILGATSGVGAAVLSNPTEVVKVQMQAEGRRKLQGLHPKFKNCRGAYVQIFREGGISGFWRGALPNAQRAALVNIGDLAAYDYFKRLMLQSGSGDNMSTHAMSAFGAGFVAALLGTPADFLKTRLMNQPFDSNGRPKLYSGMIDCARKAMATEGAFALYKGFVPMWLRLGPWAFINWITFEQIMVAIGGKSF